MFSQTDSFIHFAQGTWSFYIFFIPKEFIMGVEDILCELLLLLPFVSFYWNLANEITFCLLFPFRNKFTFGGNCMRRETLNCPLEVKMNNFEIYCTKIANLFQLKCVREFVSLWVYKIANSRWSGNLWNEIKDRFGKQLKG
jgi:hypothetical protein